MPISTLRSSVHRAFSPPMSHSPCGPRWISSRPRSVPAARDTDYSPVGQSVWDAGSGGGRRGDSAAPRYVGSVSVTVRLVDRDERFAVATYTR
jgi:hypothetical protein